MLQFDDVVREAYGRYEGKLSFEEFRQVAREQFAQLRKHISSSRTEIYRLPYLGTFQPLYPRAAQYISRRLRQLEQERQVEKQLKSLENLYCMLAERFPEKMELNLNKINEVNQKTQRLVRARVRLPEGYQFPG